MSKRNARQQQRLHAQVFAALGDPSRLMLIGKLSDGQPRSIIWLSSDFPLSRQAITKHLRVLEDAGIVRSDRVGRESLFSYMPEPINDARSYLDRVGEQWNDALARLQAFVENAD